MTPTKGEQSRRRTTIEGRQWQPSPTPGLLLKIMPPKLRKTLLVRERLRRFGAGGRRHRGDPG
jgi:hypothetical protein